MLIPNIQTPAFAPLAFAGTLASIGTTGTLAKLSLPVQCRI